MTPPGGRIVIGIAAVAAVAPAAAQPAGIALPAGRLGEQVMALGRSARVSIVVPDD